MGKRDKKKKISGSQKTLMKTEKKLEAKRKKELASLGEEDIEKVIAQIEKEEARRLKVEEYIVPPPSRRVNCSLTPHPYKDELIMFGGELYDGHKSTVYGDLFFYNISKDEWTVVKAPNAPPPRSCHQAISTHANNGELWIFGGEFSSPSEWQFHHYKDLWKFNIGEKKWEKIIANGGPSPRSGHRMVNIKKNLYIFGGFFDDHVNCQYFNDVYCFNMETYTWRKIVATGNRPSPRSGCIVLPTPENKILIYGGYSKIKKNNIDEGCVHSDMFLLSPAENDETGLKWQWLTVKAGGVRISPRCSVSAVIVQPNVAYIFGGVYDEEDNDKELHGLFYNDLFSLNLIKPQWYRVTLSGKSESAVRKRRRKVKGNETELSDKEDEIENDAKDEPIETTLAKTVITDDDGIFTVTLGPKATTNTSVSDNGTPANMFTPSPRINCCLAVKNNILYMYGGIFERGIEQYTLSDFYSLDCKKLDEWKTIIKDNLPVLEWSDSSSSNFVSDSDENSSDNYADGENDNDEDDDDDDDKNDDDDDR